MELPEEPRLNRPQSQPTGLVQRVNAIFSEQKEQPVLEDSVQKKKVKPKQRELPSVKPATSVKMSQ